MEQIPSLKLSHKISQSLQQSRINDGPKGQVNSHCKKDHLTPSPFDERNNISSYISKHSPIKHLPNYNKPEVEKELQNFRKYENSTANLSNLPSILDNSHYQDAFQVCSHDKLLKEKGKQSWFFKMKWALDPTSDYQNNYSVKDGAVINKQNKWRPDNNHFSVFPLQSNQRRNSNYKTQFQPYAIKKEAEYVIGNTDHLGSKENLNKEIAILQYQRRYDSVIGEAKPKQKFVSIYKKEAAIGKQYKL